MKVMAIICEYNPFHNGHAYQLQKQKEDLGADAVICLMSSSFVQRGEPAIVDKWARAKMALCGGCDLVLELPALYSLQSAEGFAFGAVSLLTKLGFEGYLCFGSESGDIKLLGEIAEAGFSPVYHEKLRETLQTGISYPKACAAAMQDIIPKAGEIVSSPNNMLGIEYLRALSKTGSKLVPKTVQREFGLHDSFVAQKGFLSATAIRDLLLNGEDVSAYMPQKAYEILMDEFSLGRGPVTKDGLNQLICYAIRQTDTESLSAISGVSEGLEHRLKDVVKTARTFQSVAELAKTKRYPYTRICRVLMNILLGITKEDEQLAPAYARILGIGKKGREVLRFLKETATIPVITKTANGEFSEKNAKRLFEIEEKATDLYALLYPNPAKEKNGMDFYRSPVILEQD
ncbi:MAG: nucleotidyltransferase [Clostridia bacterium]|nr:nucleotidyltransferase [Clostridia bacterium]